MRSLRPLAALAVLAATDARATDLPPNVVLILADDLGLADVSTTSPGGVPTPNLDRLASEGVRFTSGYVAAPICGPSRAALFTGRYPQRFGFEFNPGQELDPTVGLPPEEVTLAEVLRDAGYATGLVGKWHLGYREDQHPIQRGFDEFYGFLGGETSYIDPAAPDVVSVSVPGFDLTERMGPSALTTGWPPVVVDAPGRYLTEDLADRAAGFVRRHAAEPFFLVVAFNAPHTPFQVTRTYYDRFPDEKDEARRVYAGMIAALDDGVGVVLDTLDALSLADDTLVVFLSDNGCAPYTGVCACSPVRGGKGAHLDGGVRVPFLARWPWHLPAGVDDDHLVSSLDLFPTIAAAASVPVDGLALDGVDLAPFVARDRLVPHAALFWRTGTQRAARLGDLKLWGTSDGTELFDLRADPLETTDVAELRPRASALAERAYAAWAAEMVEPAWPMTESVTLDQCGDLVTLP